jgi:hypothetical protein
MEVMIQMGLVVVEVVGQVIVVMEEQVEQV